MKYQALTKCLVEALVTDPESITVKEFPSDEEDKIIIEVLVSQDDLPRVIGKGGRTINSIRTIVQASSNLHDHKYVTINIDSF